jgi:predicted 2-oxoglutarate/Fe(II)-dependent dioxygenase YbiX
MIEQEKLFSKEECNMVINYVESLNNWNRIVSPKNNYVKFSYFIQDISQHELLQNTFLHYVKEKLKYNVEEVTIMVLKYSIGDFFGKHIDTHGVEKEVDEFSHDGIENVNMVLNDEFEGGNFYLADVNISTTPGNVYHYKSNVYHEVTPVTSGTRYSMLCYLRTRNLIKKQNKTLL